MKVLWFEVSTPSLYNNSGVVTGGWQDSLERIISSHDDIELYIAFESRNNESKVKVNNGVTYIPLNIHYNFIDNLKERVSWQTNKEKLLPLLQQTVQTYQPDLIHVFGTEWPFGLIASLTDIPVVIHIQGAMAPYNNAFFPPKYSFLTNLFSSLYPQKILFNITEYFKTKSRERIEQQIWRYVRFYMGRTHWDEALSFVMNPSRIYFHVEEALRPGFTDITEKWTFPDNHKIKLFTTGCSSFWKGPDMMLKTAKILKDYGLNFEWNVAGFFPDNVKKSVEKNEKTTFSQVNISLLGPVDAIKLKKYLLESNLYIHTAYIENSPNSVCEAQCIGIPIVSTNVGGISSLLDNGTLGKLVPANDPWQLAYEIINLLNDKEEQLRLSAKGREYALARHNHEHIYSQIFNCYSDIINKKYE